MPDLIKDMYKPWGGRLIPTPGYFRSPYEREELYGGRANVRVYGLTDLGKRVTRTMEGSGDEMRVLNYLRDNKTATDDQLDVVAERWVVKGLKRRGLIKELTDA